MRDTGVRLAAAALAWLLGIAWQMQQPALWSASGYLALTLAAVTLLVCGACGPTRGRGGLAAVPAAGPRAAGLCQHRLARGPAARAGAAGRTGRQGPATHRRHRRHAAAGAAGHTFCFSGGAGPAGRSAGAGAAAHLDGLVPRLRWRHADRQPRAGIACRPALVAHCAAAPAARHAQPARLRPRAVALRAGHPRQRQRARVGRKPDTQAGRRRGLPGGTRTPVGARRDPGARARRAGGGCAGGAGRG